MNDFRVKVRGTPEIIADGFRTKAVARLSKTVRALEQQVRSANADVRAAVDVHRGSFVGPVRENARARAEALIRKAQQKSDAFLDANGDLVNARAYADSCSRGRR